MSKVAIKTQGGLGNQMFQYAAGRALADKFGEELLIDASMDPAWPSYRPLALDGFKLNAQIVEWKMLSTAHIDRPQKRRQNAFIKFKGFTPFRQHVGHYDPRIHDAPKNAYLFGWWMSEKHFVGHEESIRQDFEPAMPSSAAKNWEKLIRSTEDSVSVHVRRGDLVETAYGAELMGVIDPEYYGRAAKELQTRNPSATPTYFVFSDDPRWCAESLDLPGTMAIVSGSELSMHDDLYLMSLCDHAVNANSTFSWWGAWLGEGRGNSEAGKPRTVIVPKVFFKNEAVDAQQGMMPDRWTQI